MPDSYRLYDPVELGPDGYPPAWHEVLKHEVRQRAGHRCVRCGHPYHVGQSVPEWSPCFSGCTHSGPVRYRHGCGERWLFSDAMVPAGQIAYDLSHTTVDPANPRDVLGPIEIEARWRVLTVHHLDGDKANCRWWNLAPLCQRCHLQIQGRVQMARVWPWEHSEWFKPYAAGWYAWTYLGEDLTRKQVISRQDELLALERVA